MKDNRKNLSHEEAESNINKANLDALMLDADENTDTSSTKEDPVNFDAFMAEYRNLMGQTPDDESEAQADKSKDPQEQFLTSLPKKKDKKLNKTEKVENHKNNSDWNEDITLAPEEYEELDDGRGMTNEPEEEETKPDFNLGESVEDSDDKFQLSINFDGENKTTVTDDVKKERKYDPDHPRAIDWVFDIVEMFVMVLAIVLIITSFIFKHSIVNGDSMLNTLEHGDHLIISDVFYTPSYGDIVVFEDYSKNEDFKIAVIKRVIARSGDTVEIRPAEDGHKLVVLVNEKPLVEDYAYYLPNGQPFTYGPITLEEDQIFVMGDNRYNSTDSCDVGPIDIDCILGKVIFRFSPFDKFGAVK